jgi:hypothetical protein
MFVGVSKRTHARPWKPKVNLPEVPLPPENQAFNAHDSLFSVRGSRLPVLGAWQTEGAESSPEAVLNAIRAF